MGELAEFVKRNPAAIGVAVIVVALLAYMQSQKPAAAGELQFTGGGTAPNPVDPGVVAMEESRISAGSSNISTLASLLLGREEIASALSARRSEVDAALTSDLARTDAGLRTSLAATEASRTVGLAQVQSQTSIAGIYADSATAQAKMDVDARNEAARLSFIIQNRIADANIQQNELNAHRDLEQLATQRDIVRVEAKAGFWSDIVDFGSDLVGGLAAVFGF